MLRSVGFVCLFVCLLLDGAGVKVAAPDGAVMRRVGYCLVCLSCLLEQVLKVAARSW